jgi:predicted aspartyl protease
MPAANKQIMPHPRLRKRVLLKLSIFIILYFFRTASAQVPATMLNQGGFLSDAYFIELPYQDINGKLIIEATLGGQTRRFMVDTGAPMVISKNLAESLNVKQLWTMDVADIHQNTNELRVVQLDSLLLGNYIMNGLPALVVNDNPILSCLGIDGLLGSNALRNSVIQFNTNTKTIRLTDTSAKLQLKETEGLAMQLDQQSSPYLPVRIGKKITDYALFDSGSDDFYAMAHSKIDKFIRAKEFTVFARSYGSNTFGMFGTAESTETAVLKMPAVQLGKVQITDVMEETFDEANSRLGNKLLNYGLLTLDYRNKKYFFEGFTTHTSYKEQLLPVSLTMADNRLVIGKIWTGELQKIFPVGDQVIAVNE